MGFGRIGRNLFRILYRRDDVRIVAISDTADPAALEYLLRFDTILGRFPDEVAVREGNLYAWGRQVRLLAGSGWEVSIGRSIVNAAPRPSGLSTLIRPPCSLMMP